MERDRCFKPEADYGYCAAKALPYYGFKMGLRISRSGMIVPERYRIAHTRACDLWHYQSRLNRKVLSHTICVLINLQLGRPPLHLDDLALN